MSAELQSTFFDKGNGETVEIVTDGRTVRPLANLMTAIVDETKVHVSDRGLEMTHVDPANVAMVDLHVHPEAFETFEATGEDTIGLHTEEFQSLVSNARMSTRTNDRVELTVDADKTLVTVEKEYPQTTVRKTDSLLNIDPDSIRKEPDPPALDLPVRASVDVDALHDVLDTFRGDHVALKADDGHLLVTTHEEIDSLVNKSFVDFGDVGATADVASVFSLDYVGDLVAALKRAKVDTVDIRLGEQFPVMLEFEKVAQSGDDETTIVDGRLMVAPRVTGGDD